MADIEAADGKPGRSVEVGKARRSRLAQDVAHGPGRQAEERPDPVGTPAPFGASVEDPLDLLRPRESRRSVGSRAPVGETGHALGPIATDPLVACRPADAHRLQRDAHRPALDRDGVHEQRSTEDVETGLRMGGESLLTARIFDNPNRARRLSLVNNVLVTTPGPPAARTGIPQSRIARVSFRPSCRYADVPGSSRRGEPGSHSPRN